jgi:hypothetical protein
VAFSSPDGSWPSSVNGEAGPGAGPEVTGPT